MRVRLCGVLAIGALSSACVSLQKGWAIDPTLVDIAPYYVGTAALGKAPVGHFPVAFDRGAHPPPDYPSDSVMAPLISRMTAFVDDLKATHPLPGSSSPANGAPEVYVGCVLLNRDCDAATPAAQISVRMPTSGWLARVRAGARQARVEYVILIAVRLVRFHASADSSSLSIGTGRRVPRAQPSVAGQTVELLELTGALADAEGNVLRAGAEGLLVRQSGGPMTSAEIARLIDGRRHVEFPNAPTDWELALQNLVGQLLKKSSLIQP